MQYGAPYTGAVSTPSTYATGMSSPESNFGTLSPTPYSVPTPGPGGPEAFMDPFGGSFGAPSTTSASASTITNDSSWDPFFGEDKADDKAATAASTAPTEEKGASDDSDPENDDDSDIDDEEDAEIQAFDETSLAKVIPESFPDESAMKDFLLAPIESEKLVKCIIMFDSIEKVWTFTNQSNGVRLMTAFKRKDGLKRLTTQMQWAINFSPRAIEQDQKRKSRGGLASWGSMRSKSGAPSSKSAEYYLAKIKSNVGGSSFEVFDTGLNPSKAVGAMHARRELGAVRFERLAHDSYRRKALRL
ncbi:Tubby protein-like [Durusdinium trenchii]|uniref:Tubby protein-like n=1 Tax=Durusdinium trenchii TaxID=1381693 RepID=A0ABP0IXN1_9DINO